MQRAPKSKPNRSGIMCAAADVEELNALHLMVSDTSAEYQLRYAEVRSSV